MTVRESDKLVDASQDLDLEEPLEPEPVANLGWLFGGPLRALERGIDSALREAGHGAIRPAHGPVFENLAGEGSRITDMAARANLTKQSMQYLVDDLERAGYVERVSDPLDRRAKLVRATPEGRRAVLVARQAIADAEAGWAASLGPSKLARLRKLLEQLNAVIADTE